MEIYVATYQCQFLRECLVLFRPVTNLEELILLPGRLGILVPEPPEVLPRRGVDDLLVYLPTDLGVFV